MCVYNVSFKYGSWSWMCDLILKMLKIKHIQCKLTKTLLVDHIYRLFILHYSSSRPALCHPSPATWHCLPTRGCGIPHGAPRTWRASRHPSPPRAHWAAGASRLVPGIPCSQPEKLSLQTTAVAPPQWPAIHAATQDRLPGQEPWWVEEILKFTKGPASAVRFCLLGSEGPNLLLLWNTLICQLGWFDC